MFPNLAQYAARTVEQYLNHPGGGTPVKLRWVTRTGGTPDPTTGAVVGATVTAHEKTIRAAVHVVQPTQSMARMFAEVQAGNVILDLDPAEVIEGLEELEFEIDGALWVQKRIPEAVLSKLSTELAGKSRIYKTILLQMKK